MNETTQSQPQVVDSEAAGNRFRLSTVLMWAAVFSLLSLLGWGLVKASETRPEAGENAPDFTLEFFNGYEWEQRESADLEAFRGQIVVVNFWASWCVECKLEAATLENTWRKYKDQGVVFLGVTYADVEPNALQYLIDYDVTYPNAPDLGTKISADYEITGVPETFFIDKSGVISFVQIGPVNEQMLEGTIEQLLAQGG